MRLNIGNVPKYFFIRRSIFGIQFLRIVRSKLERITEIPSTRMWQQPSLKTLNPAYFYNFSSCQSFFFNTSSMDPTIIQGIFKCNASLPFIQTSKDLEIDMHTYYFIYLLPGATFTWQKYSFFLLLLIQMDIKSLVDVFESCTSRFYFPPPIFFLLLVRI